MSANLPSTTTHLELVNLVLLNAAEQPVRTVGETVASKRASVSLKRAVNDILLLGSWSFSRTVSPPSGWDDVTRTVEHTLTQVEDVWYEERTLTFVDWQDHAVAGYTDGEPHYWTKVNYSTLILAPYPTDPEQQSKVRVVGYAYPAPMVADGDTSGLPDSFIDALVSRATGAFILRDHGDPTLANQFNNEFEIGLQSLRDRDRGNPRRTGNMLFRPH
jgi:hypothetical protein